MGTAARPVSKSRSTLAAARSPPRGRGKVTSRVTRSVSSSYLAASPVDRSTFSRVRRALSVRARHLSAQPLFTFRHDPRPLVTPNLCTRGGAPRPSLCRATTLYLHLKLLPTGRPAPVNTPHIQETRKRESHIRGPCCLIRWSSSSN